MCAYNSAEELQITLVELILSKFFPFSKILSFLLLEPDKKYPVSIFNIFQVQGKQNRLFLIQLNYLVLIYNFLYNFFHKYIIPQKF